MPHYINWRIAPGMWVIKFFTACVPTSHFDQGECGSALARNVILGSGKEYFYPHKRYCFNSVIDQVEGLLQRPGVPEMWQQWRERQLEDNIIAGVYDGSIRKDFLEFKSDDLHLQ